MDYNNSGPLPCSDPDCQYFLLGSFAVFYVFLALRLLASAIIASAIVSTVPPNGGLGQTIIACSFRCFAGISLRFLDVLLESLFLSGVAFVSGIRSIFL